MKQPRLPWRWARPGGARKLYRRVVGARGAESAGRRRPSWRRSEDAARPLPPHDPPSPSTANDNTTPTFLATHNNVTTPKQKQHDAPIPPGAASRNKRARKNATSQLSGEIAEHFWFGGQKGNGEKCHPLVCSTINFCCCCCCCFQATFGTVGPSKVEEESAGKCCAREVNLVPNFACAPRRRLRSS